MCVTKWGGVSKLGCVIALVQRAKIYRCPWRELGFCKLNWCIAAFETTIVLYSGFRIKSVFQQRKLQRNWRVCGVCYRECIVHRLMRTPSVSSFLVTVRAWEGWKFERVPVFHVCQNKPVERAAPEGANAANVLVLWGWIECRATVSVFDHFSVTIVLYSFLKGFWRSRVTERISLVFTALAKLNPIGACLALIIRQVLIPWNLLQS